MSPFNRGPMYCRNCEAHEIKTEIYFDNVHKSQSGKSIPLEKSTGQPHKCPYSPYALKQKAEEDFIEGRGYMLPPRDQPSVKEVVKTTSQSLETAAIISKLDNQGIKLVYMATQIEMIGNTLNRILESNEDKRDRMQLLQKIAELEDALKQKGLVQKASEIKPIGHHSELVDDIVQEGQSEEELDLTE